MRCVRGCFTTTTLFGSLLMPATSDKEKTLRDFLGSLGCFALLNLRMSCISPARLLDYTLKHTVPVSWLPHIPPPAKGLLAKQTPANLSLAQDRGSPNKTGGGHQAFQAVQANAEHSRRSLFFHFGAKPLLAPALHSLALLPSHAL